VFDPAANLILWWCHKKAQRVDYKQYPGGGSKFESIGASLSSSSLSGAGSFALSEPVHVLGEGSHADALLLAGDIVYSGIMGAVSLILVVRPAAVRPEMRPSS